MSTENPTFDLKEVQAQIATHVTSLVETKTQDMRDQLAKGAEFITTLQAKLDSEETVVANITEEMQTEQYQKSLSDALHATFGGCIEGVKDLGEIKVKSVPLTTNGHSTGESNGTQDMGAEGAIDSELGRRIIERARENVVILGLVGRKQVSSVDYREMVLTGLPKVSAGVENVWGSPTTAHPAWADTDVQRYVTVQLQVAKQYAKPFISNEAIHDPAIDLMAHLEVLLAEEQSRYWAQQILAGNGASGNLRGILSTKRLNTTESLKPTATRSVEYFPYIKSGVGNAIGASGEAVINNLIDMTTMLPSKYQDGAYFLMNRHILGNMRKINVSDSEVATYTSHDLTPLLTFTEAGFEIFGFPVIIEDYFPNEGANLYPIMFGDLSKAVAMVDIDDHFLLDPYSADGGVLLKHESRKGEIMQANDAVVFLKCEAISVEAKDVANESIDA